VNRVPPPFGTDIPDVRRVLRGKLDKLGLGDLDVNRVIRR
jgi:hypothetical protein